MTRPPALSFVAALVVTLGACASNPTPATSAAPAAAPTSPVAMMTSSIALVVPPTAPDAHAPALPASGLPLDWHLRDETADGYAGIGDTRAMKDLLASKQPKRTVLVAVIDGGIDTAHVDLRPNIWVNPKEVAGNHVDDDRNGHVDDIHGWNFIGGKDGRNVDHDTFEVTRQFVACHRMAPGGDVTRLAEPDKARCAKVASDYQKQKDDLERELPNIKGADATLTQVTQILSAAAHTDSLTDAIVDALPASASNPQVAQAKSIWHQLSSMGINRQAITDAIKETTNQLQFSLDTTYNPRVIVGDDTLNLTQKDYGNPDVTGPDAFHGTHVSGIIGAVRGNGIGMDGIASAVKIMMVRTIPDGDERDKDVANAIRYAVDNGAMVINMSFGKPYSPYKSTVDDAVRYADEHGVLMVHAAGNDGANTDSVADFPNAYYLNGGKAHNWLEVGASSWKGDADLPAQFSNYGQTHVDLFAPGEDIYSTAPGNKYQKESGTSMAAPVVTGVAALLMSYYPQLSAADIKQIILSSVTRHDTQIVNRPGDTPAKVAFGTLSSTGGVVNVYAAIQMAEKLTSKKP